MVCVFEKKKKISDDKTESSFSDDATISLKAGDKIALVDYGKKQGSRSARLSPQSMIHYARKVFKCSIRIVQSFTIL